MYWYSRRGSFLDVFDLDTRLQKPLLSFAETLKTWLYIVTMITMTVVIEVHMIKDSRP